MVSLHVWGKVVTICELKYSFRYGNIFLQYGSIELFYCMGKFKYGHIIRTLTLLLGGCGIGELFTNDQQYYCTLKYYAPGEVYIKRILKNLLVIAL